MSKWTNEQLLAINSEGKNISKFIEELIVFLKDILLIKLVLSTNSLVMMRLK